MIDKKIGGCEERVASYNAGDVLIISGIEELKQKMLCYNKMAILLMCKRGRLQIKINGKRIMMEESELLLIMHKSLISDLSYSIDVDCAAICLNSTRIHKFLRTQDMLNILLTVKKCPLLRVSEQQFHNLITLKENIKYMFSPLHPYYEKIMSHFVEIILYDILGCYIKVANKIISSNIEIPNRKNQIFVAFMTLLHEDKGAHREVRYFANKLFITPKYLSSICKEISGKTCAQWLAEIAIEEIKQMLNTTEMSIKEIACKLKFDNYAFFSKYVKKHLGLSPIEYRLKYNESK